MPFEKKLVSLAGKVVTVSAGRLHPAPELASISINFSSGEVLTAEYWRIVDCGHAGVSSFDHQQQYGLPAPVDAVLALQEKICDRYVEEARLDPTTGDLLFRFSGDTNLQVFNFTGYEVWQMTYPDGTVEYSNYNK